MNLSELFSLLIIVLYALGTLLIIAGTVLRKDQLKKLSNWSAVAGFALHSGMLLFAMMGSDYDLSKGYYIQFLSWSLLFIYFFLWWRMRLSFLGLTASPLAMLLFIGSFTLTTVQGKLPEEWTGMFFGLHIGTLFLSFGLLAMAFGAGLIFIRLERKIKTKEQLTEFDKDMPALATFDRVNHVAVMAGFPLYTIGMASGFIWARLAWGRLLSADPKEIVSIFVWFVFAWLFHQRLAAGWRGRKAAKAVIWLFAISVFSLIGINVFMPTHHSFIQ
jgi:ABC-type uncharacterized transport system permease subunit